MRKLPHMTVAILILILSLSITGCGSSTDGKTHLTFQIWDVYQRPGMQAMCDAYTAQHPDVVIEVQATSWSEYWTKLEASAESNTMPDIFWMHTNQLLYYADFGMLADVTDLYDDVESDYYEKHFSEISRSNASGSDGRLYGVPKDKDNGMLVYNKEMFDAAGVPYPTDDVTRHMGREHDFFVGDFGFIGIVFLLLVVFREQLLAALVGGGRNGGFIVAPLNDCDFTVRAWQVCALLSPGFRAKKEQDTFSDFLLGCAANRRWVFSYFYYIWVTVTSSFPTYETR